MSDPIYLVRDNQQAIRMEPKAYATEDEFQSLLERFPELLAGEQVDRENPRRWLLVAREIGIPDGEAAASRWNLDHLFIDQDGIPTLVEVKRRQDPRLRREVVAQMLDYAANANRYWPGAFLQQQFEDTSRKAGRDPDAVLAEFLDNRAVDATAFWRSVEGRLREGEMRLIFFADAVPAELQRIVEFLNSQMSKTEVLAIELTRYAGEGFSTHVPRLIGQTAEATDAKAASRTGGQRRRWDEPSFFAAAAVLPQATQDALRVLVGLAAEPGFVLRWGTGAANGSANVIAPAVCERSLVTASSNGSLTLNLGWLDGSPEAEKAKATLAVFGRDVLGLTSSVWMTAAPAIWTPKVNEVLGLLRGLRG